MKSKCVFPDYHNSGLNVAASVLRHFGAPCTQVTHAKVDALLEEKPYKNIVVMLFDGMGMMALEKHLPPDAFLRRHVHAELSSVFPPTTVAATTAIESGYAPVETAWVGWSQYFAQIDRTVDVFTNRESFTGTAIDGEKTVANTFIPYRNICDRLHETGRVQAHIVSPYGTERVYTLDALFDQARALCCAPGRRYIYTYWNEPDYTMHGHGVDAAGESVREINERVQAFCEQADDDTLVLVTADHGLVDCKMVYVTQHSELADMCMRPPSLEARATAFFVKPECRQAFPQAFARAFGQEHFWLIPSDEALRRGLFGPGEAHPQLRSFLGDYLAIATDQHAIGWEYDPEPLIGMHAGMTKDEMRVPLIVGKK